MPRSKNAAIRYLVLDRCFSDMSARYFIDDLIEACRAELARVNGTWGSKGAESVSRRQIYDDMNQMEMIYEVEIAHIKDGHKRYHTYAEGSKTLSNTGLRQDELNTVNDAMLILKRFEGLPQLDWMGDLENKLYSTSRLGENTNSVVSFQRNQYLRGMEEWYKPIFDAIVARKTIRLQYHPFGKDFMNVDISPYHLKQYNNRWFLIGKRSDYGGLSNYAIDRIESIEDSEKPFESLPDDFSFDEFFEDVVGVSVIEGAPVENVTLYVSPQRFSYIDSKPLHPSQSVKRQPLPDGRFQVNLKVQINMELRTLLRSFGADIEVIAPESLRNQMADEVSALMKMYHSI